MKLVQGIGINDNKYPTQIKGTRVKEYELWVNMLERCYSKRLHTRRPTYIGCSVSDNFKHYSYFYQWCQTQVGFGLKGSDLDKDIVLRGNKIYSENTCVFVPYEVNSFFIERGADRGEYPIGVSFYKAIGKYIARCNVNSKSKHLGYFTTPEEAFITYKQFKEDLCKQTALKWKASIDPRVYDAMMNWHV